MTTSIIGRLYDGEVSRAETLEEIFKSKLDLERRKKSKLDLERRKKSKLDLERRKGDDWAVLSKKSRQSNRKRAKNGLKLAM